MENMQGSRFAGANLQCRASPRKNVGKEAIDSLARINTSGRQLGQEKASFFSSLASYRRRTPTEFGPHTTMSNKNMTRRVIFLLLVGRKRLELLTSSV